MEGKALTDFMRYTDAELLILGKAVVVEMTNNAKYPAAAPLVNEVNAITTAYEKALSVALYGGRFQKEIKNALKADLKKALKKLCNHVNHETPGNRVALSTTGFRLNHEQRTFLVTQPLKRVTVKNWKNRGEIQVWARTGADTTGVQVEFAVAATLQEITTWTLVPGSTKKRIIRKLPSGRNVFVRAAATGPREQIVYAALVQTIVL